MPPGKYPGVSKPRPGKNLTSNYKTSDRRLAAGRQPAQFLSSVVKASSPSSQNVSRTAEFLQAFKSRQQNLARVTEDGKVQTVRRRVGDLKWEDPTLLEWDPKHFRIFVGNLGGDVTDEVLYRAFVNYTSLSKVRVVTDAKTGDSKGYGFVSFADTNDYLRALNDMNGKYIGQRPVQLKRAKTEIKPVVKSIKKK